MDLESAISNLGADIEQLKAEYLRISSTLKKLGLSEYEARAYVALVALGPSSASFVAEIAQIPRTSAYKTMLSLERKGFVSSLAGRPRTFSPADPSTLADRYVKEVAETFSKISSVKDLLSQRGVPQMVYTIMGRERVLDKIGEMIDKSQSSFVISSPSFSQLRRSLGKRLSSALTRGVRVTVITSPFVKVPRSVSVVRRKGLIATDVISDGKMALLAAPDLSACGYTDNETLSKHLEDFLHIMAERAD